VVRKDLGAAEAARVAREAVMPLERSGGQAQFIEHRPPQVDDHGSLAALGGWVERNLHDDLSLEVLSRRAAVSARTLTRHVRRQLGTSPAHWVASLRVRRAQQLLETTSLSIERVAEEVGFGSSSVLREQFARVVKVSPSRWRSAYRR
jgi:transcriptional regulator GlxA family with amidase domain